MREKNYIFCFYLLGTLFLNAKTTTFDNLNANPLTNKAITWLTSNYGSGFGHRIINSDPGGLTLLNFQGRNNTTMWSDIMTLTSNGNVGIGTNSPAQKLSIQGNNSSVSVSQTSYNYSSTIPIGAQFGVWDGTFTNAAGIKFHRYRGVANSFANAYIGQASASGEWGLDFRVENQTSASNPSQSRMFIKPDGKIGIGTTSPKAVLDVSAYIENENLGIVYGRLYEGYSNGDGTYLGVKGYGTQNSSYNGKSFSIVHNFYGETNSSINFFRGGGTTGGFLTFNTKDNEERMRILGNGNVAIGTTDTKGFKLGVLGKIAEEEVKVAIYNNWADFVFAKDYHLPSLIEVEKHIKENGHLQNIPSAKEVVKNGIFLGEMNAKLLQKIEELTLYTINQEKRINTLEEENKALKAHDKRIAQLEEKIAVLLNTKQ